MLMASGTIYVGIGEKISKTCFIFHVWDTVAMVMVDLSKKIVEKNCGVNYFLIFILFFTTSHMRLGSLIGVVYRKVFNHISY